MDPAIQAPLLRPVRLTAPATPVATVAGLLSGQGLVFELLCHFRLHVG